MQKLFITLIILMTLQFKGISQIAYDSIKIPSVHLKKAINIIENGKVIKQELALTQSKSKTQDSLLATKDIIINAYAKKDSIYNKSIESYKIAAINFQEIIKNQEQVFDIQQGLLRKEKRKKFIYLPIGILIGFAIFHH